MKTICYEDIHLTIVLLTGVIEYFNNILILYIFVQKYM